MIQYLYTIYRVLQEISWTYWSVSLTPISIKKVKFIAGIMLKVWLGWNSRIQPVRTAYTMKYLSRSEIDREYWCSECLQYSGAALNNDICLRQWQISHRTPCIYFLHIFEMCSFTLNGISISGMVLSRICRHIATCICVLGDSSNFSSNAMMSGAPPSVGFAFAP